MVVKIRRSTFRKGVGVLVALLYWAITSIWPYTFFVPESNLFPDSMLILVIGMISSLPWILIFPFAMIIEIIFPIENPFLAISLAGIAWGIIGYLCGWLYHKNKIALGFIAFIFSVLWIIAALFLSFFALAISAME